MKHAFTELPDGYRGIGGLDLQKNKKTALLVNGAAAAVMVLMLVGMHLLVPWQTVLGDLTSPDGFAPVPLLIRMAALVVGYVVYIVLHELTHAAVMKYFGAGKLRFGFTGLYAFAGSEGDFFDRYAFLRVSLAPLLVWGVVFLVLQFLVPLSWFWVVWFWQIGNVSGAAGDVYVTWKLSRMPRDVLVRDTGLSMTFYSAE